MEMYQSVNDFFGTNLYTVVFVDALQYIMIEITDKND